MESRTIIEKIDGIELGEEHRYSIKEIDNPKKLRFYATMFSYNLTKEQVIGLTSKDKMNYLISGDSYFFNCILRKKIKDNYIIPISYSVSLALILAEKAVRGETGRGNILIGSYYSDKKWDDKHKLNDIEVGEICKDFLRDYREVKGKSCVDEENLSQFLKHTSRNQALITAENDELYIHNLGSNGTTRFKGTFNNKEISDCTQKTKLIESNEEWAGVSFGLPIAKNFSSSAIKVDPNIKGYSLIMMVTPNPLIEGRDDIAEKLK